MRRVLVIGSGGAGKTTFALELRRRSRLPVVHLDRHDWGPGWREPARDEWRAQVARLVAEPAWIMDGHYGRTLDLRIPAADLVVFLDYPPWLCLRSVLWRSATGFGRGRPDIADGCPERFDLPFLRHVARFRRDSRPRVLAAVERCGALDRLIVLRTRRAARRWLDAVFPSGR